MLHSITTRLTRGRLSLALTRHWSRTLSGYNLIGGNNSWSQTPSFPCGLALPILFVSLHFPPSLSPHILFSSHTSLFPIPETPLPQSLASSLIPSSFVSFLVRPFLTGLFSGDSISLCLVWTWLFWSSHKSARLCLHSEACASTPGYKVTTVGPQRSMAQVAHASAPCPFPAASWRFHRV